MGAAFAILAAQLKMPPMAERALPPVMVLVSDGMSTDDYSRGLSEIMALPWGKKAVRIAIAIGGDADHEVLEKFIAHAELKPLQANNPEALIRYIRWASTAVLKEASAPSSQSDSTRTATGNVPIPPLPDREEEPSAADDIW
jgi:uncharacterized protein YegL